MVHARQRGVSIGDLNSRGFSPEQRTQMSGAHFFGACAILTMIYARFMRGEGLWLTLTLSLPLILISLIWQMMVIIRIREAQR